MDALEQASLSLSLGYGGFGAVWLEVDKPDTDNAKKRAVKVVSKGRMRQISIDYKQEIAALAKFLETRGSKSLKAYCHRREVLTCVVSRGGHSRPSSRLVRE
jgi:hypothetical protein